MRVPVHEAEHAQQQIIIQCIKAHLLNHAAELVDALIPCPSVMCPLSVSFGQLLRRKAGLLVFQLLGQSFYLRFNFHRSSVVLDPKMPDEKKESSGRRFVATIMVAVEICFSDIFL